MYIYKYMYIHNICTYMCVEVYTYENKYEYICTNMYTIYVYINIYIYIYIYIHTYIHICVFIKFIRIYTYL